MKARRKRNKELAKKKQAKKEEAQEPPDIRETLAYPSEPVRPGPFSGIVGCIYRCPCMFVCLAILLYVALLLACFLDLSNPEMPFRYIVPVPPRTRRARQLLSKADSEILPAGS